MYLSSLSLDLSNPSARQALRNGQDMHRNIMRAFPQAEGAARLSSGVLYRIEQESAYSSKYTQLRLLVMSSDIPNWEVISPLGFVSNSDPKDISALRHSFEVGRLLHFELVAIPSKKMNSGSRNSRRRMLRSPEEREAWLRRKGEQNGFSIGWVTEVNQVEVVGKHSRGQEGDFHLRGTRFQGALRIENQEQFTSGFFRGIGSGKAYGFGLLTLSR